MSTDKSKTLLDCVDDVIAGQGEGSPEATQALALRAEMERHLSGNALHEELAEEHSDSITRAIKDFLTKALDKGGLKSRIMKTLRSATYPKLAEVAGSDKLGTVARWFESGYGDMGIREATHSFGGKLDGHSYQLQIRAKEDGSFGLSLSSDQLVISDDVSELTDHGAIDSAGATSGDFDKIYEMAFVNL